MATSRTGRSSGIAMRLRGAIDAQLNTWPRAAWRTRHRLRAPPAAVLALAMLCPGLPSGRAFAAGGSLVLGKPLLVRLPAAGERALTLPLSSGEFVRVHLESRGLPADVGVGGPGGAEIVAVRRVPPGSSSCSWIASTSGEYTLRLRTTGRLGAWVAVEWAARRTATPADERWMDTERTLAEASGSPAGPGQADGSGAVAAALEEASASRPCDAAAMRRRAAGVLRTLGRPAEAIPLLEQAAGAGRRCPNPSVHASIWLELASARMAAGRYDLATTRVLDRAARAAAGTSRPELRADVELARAQLDSYGIDMMSAARRYEHARSVYRASGDRAGEARAWLWAAYNHVAADPQRALEAGTSALELWEQIGDRPGKGRALQVLGLAYQSLGRTQQALDRYLEAQDTLSVDHDAAGLAAVFNGLAELYLGSGALERGLEFAQRAAELNENQPGALADSLCLLARGHFSAGHYEDAGRNARQALNIYEGLGDAKRSALARRDLARALKADGRLDSAIPLLRETLSVLAAPPAPYLEALVLSDLGEALGQQGEFGEAVTRLEAALSLYRKVGSAPDEVLALANLAQLRARMGRLSQALDDSSAALSRAEELRAALASYDLRTSYFASVSDFLEFHVDLLMTLHQRDPEAGYDLRAFQASELSRARTFIERLADPGSAASTTGKGETRRERDLAEKVDQLARRIVSGADGGAADLKRLVRLYTQARAEYDQVESATRASESRDALPGPSTPVDVRRIQEALLDDDTALVEYFIGHRRSFAWLVTRDRFASFVLPGRPALAGLVDRFDTLVRAPLLREGELPGEAYESRVVRDKARFGEAAAELSAVVLDPWLGARRERRLLVVGHESLQHVSFAALPWISGGRSRPLLETHEVVRIPSAAALAALRYRRPERPAAGILVVADPVFSPSDPRLRTRRSALLAPVPAPEPTAAPPMERGPRGADLARLPRLPASGAEAAEIARAAGAESVTVLSGFAASRESLLQEKTFGYRIVHLASHSLVDDQHPELSAVVLSRFDDQGRPTNGLLLLEDISSLRLTADLVVLSACDTGLGQDVRGEGVVGLARGFLHAGTRRVVASLWKVDDEATLELMRRFYGGLLGQRLAPGAALRQAQLAMAADPRWSFAYYWSAFELHGDWR
jgi:CHAT domain-containing protein/tetratricopeptide (TPR) repeat protein